MATRVALQAAACIFFGLPAAEARQARGLELLQREAERRRLSADDDSDLPGHSSLGSDGILRMRLYKREVSITTPAGAEEATEPAAEGWSLLQMSSRSRARTMSGANASGGAKPAPLGHPALAVYAKLTIGSPPQEFDVALDSASCNLVVTSTKCRSAACLAHRAYSAQESSTARTLAHPGAMPQPAASLLQEQEEMFALSISTGTAEGSLAVDEVCLNGDKDACVETAFLEISRMTQRPFGTFPYDGILGVGLPGKAIEERFDFMGNLAKARILKQNRFAVWLQTAEDGEDSEITFGDFDRQRAASSILWVPVSDRPHGLWQATVKDILVDGQSLSLCGSSGCQVAFDTGTAALAGPESFVEGVKNGVGLQQDCSNYKQLPNLGFQFVDTVLYIQPQDYVSMVNKKCYGQLLSLDNVTASSQSSLIFLGEPFLKRYLTIFDRDSLKIGLAFARHAQQAGSTVTSEQLASQLMVQQGSAATADGQ